MGLLSLFGASPETQSRVQKGLLDFQMAFPELRRQKMEEDQAASEAEWKKRQREMQEAQYKQTQTDRARTMNDDALIQRLYGMPTEGAMPAGQAGPGMPMPNAGIDPQTFLRQGGTLGGLSKAAEVQKLFAPKEADYKVVGDSLVQIGGVGGGVKEAYRAPEKPEKPPAPPSSVQEFEYGQKNPLYNAWDMGRRKAGATNVSVAGAKYQDAFDVANAKNFADSFGQINTAGMQAGQTLANLDRMEQLLTGVDGGKFLPAGKEIASMAESFGVRLDPKLGNKEAAEALSVEMALAMRPPGSGPMTDKDFSNFLMTVPGLAKTPSGRTQITATMRAKARRDEKMADLAQQYVEKNGRLDSGFYKEARDFIAKNPVVRRSTSADVRSQADAILGGGK